MYTFVFIVTYILYVLVAKQVQQLGIKHKINMMDM